MIGTMTDKQLLKKIDDLEGPELLALFLALYSYHREGDKETPYEKAKTKVLYRMDSKNWDCCC